MYEQPTYHCRRKGQSGCECTCDAHPPCVVKPGFVLRECEGSRRSLHTVTAPHNHATNDDDEDLECNTSLHGNIWHDIPDMQTCCNMCTNHKSCDACEYSNTKICVLKSGAPAFKPVPKSDSFAVWSGCRAGDV